MTRCFVPSEGLNDVGVFMVWVDDRFVPVRGGQSVGPLGGRGIGGGWVGR